MNKIFEMRILTGKICLILTVLTLLTAGEITAQTNIVEYAILRDVSQSRVETKVFDANDIFRKAVIELDFKDSKKGVNFRTALVGSSRIPEVRLASLEEQTSLFASQSERNKDIGQFLVKAKADMDYLATQASDQSQTNLYRVIVHVVTLLNDRATKKKIWIYSDLEEESSVFHTSKYSKDPSRIITDYDAIVEALEADAPMPDMAGIEFILVTPGKTDMHLWVSRFWEKLLKSKNASVQIRGSF